MTANITAIVLAAGLSSRMKQFKPLLPLGGVTALERIVQTYHEAGVADVRVVVGHRFDELEPVVERLGCRFVVNRRYQEGMFSSVSAGIGSLDPEIDAFFVQPVDVPLVRAATIRRLVQVYRESHSDLVYPSFLGSRGHPPLIAGRHAGPIADRNGEGGLRNVLACWEAGAVDVSVADDLVLCDMDTPDAYQSLAERVKRLDIPTPAECQALLEIHRVDERIIRHCREVARLAVEFGERLNRAGCDLDLLLLASAGLLHDITRHEPDHARTGAQLLQQFGFGAVADLVACHMNYRCPVGDPISEAAVLYLADKLVCGERRVSLTERFSHALERHDGHPEIIEKVRGRLAAAQLIQHRLESLLGHPLRGIPTPFNQRTYKHAC